MSCFRPLHAFKTGVINQKTSKERMVIQPGDVKQVRFAKKERAGPHKILITTTDLLTDYIEIPCGKCIGCRLDYAKQWAIRCTLEAKQYQNNAFVTLTYNDENIPTTEHIDKKTGEKITMQTLKPEHLTKFMKDLRRYWQYHYKQQDIKFYACGEYGDNTKRPHYHIILFNIDIPDKKFYKVTDNGDILWTSEIIENIWGKGFCPIGEADWESIAYTARYVMKKADKNGMKWLCEKNGIKPEFVRMSRQEGIGKKYFEENKNKIYELDELITKNKKGAQSTKPGRYFDKLFEMENPGKLEELKKQRMEIAKQTLLQELYGTDLTKEEYLKVKEQTKLDQIKALKRNKI